MYYSTCAENRRGACVAPMLVRLCVSVPYTLRPPPSRRAGQPSAPLARSSAASPPIAASPSPHSPLPLPFPAAASVGPTAAGSPDTCPRRRPAASAYAAARAAASCASANAPRGVSCSDTPAAHGTDDCTGSLFSSLPLHAATGASATSATVTSAAGVELTAGASGALARARGRRGPRASAFHAAISSEQGTSRAARSRHSRRATPLFTASDALIGRRTVT